MNKLSTSARGLTRHLVLPLLVGLMTSSGLAQIAAWNFTGETALATSTADTSNANLVSAPVLTRGPGAPASTGNNSFRTTGFGNNGISTANTDYFETTIAAAPNFVISLTTIDAYCAGTGTYSASPGTTNQFAYSLDGVNFILIGSPLVRVGNGAWAPERVGQALAARDRAACGSVAPPQGLCLTGVRYLDDPFA